MADNLPPFPNAFLYTEYPAPALLGLLMGVPMSLLHFQNSNVAISWRWIIVMANRIPLYLKYNCEQLKSFFAHVRFLKQNILSIEITVSKC